MTEEEARTKWCFHFIASHTDPRQRAWREADHVPATASGEPTGPFLHACIGSACMAWRWASERNPDWNPNTGAQWPSPHPSTNPAYRQSSTEGGCGLAGAPQ